MNVSEYRSYSVPPTYRSSGGGFFRFRAHSQHLSIELKVIKTIHFTIKFFYPVFVLSACSLMLFLFLSSCVLKKKKKKTRTLQQRQKRMNDWMSE